MRICRDGVYRDMTKEEIEEMKKHAEQLPPSVPSDEDRITALEQELLAFKASYEKGVDEA